MAVSWGGSPHITIQPSGTVSSLAGPSAGIHHTTFGGRHSITNGTFTLSWNSSGIMSVDTHWVPTFEECRESIELFYEARQKIQKQIAGGSYKDLF